MSEKYEDKLQDELAETVEDENERTLEEGQGHNPETAEADSVASVAKAVDATKKQPLRKGDKQNSEPMPKTKAGMINAMTMKMAKMSKEGLKGAYEGMHKEGAEFADDALVEGNFDEDLKALVESEATLSEGFKEKAEVIFEAALQSKLSEHVTRLEESYAEELAEETTRVQSELVEKVDGYLNYVVENWMEDNKIAIENGLRTEIAESFIQALHGVFNEHYIEVPEGKVDLVDQMATKVDDLEEQLNSTVEDNIELKEKVIALTRQAIIVEAATGLSEAQTEKLKSLVEDVAFDNESAFAKKVGTIKESYFKKAKTEEQSEEAQLVESTEQVTVSPLMEKYLAALKQSK
jgi:hypothetical protein